MIPTGLVTSVDAGVGVVGGATAPVVCTDACVDEAAVVSAGEDEHDASTNATTTEAIAPRPHRFDVDGVVAPDRKWLIDHLPVRAPRRVEPPVSTIRSGRDR